MNNETQIIEQTKKIDGLARNVLTLSRNTLLVNLRFLDRALSQFVYTPYSGTIATNGKHLFYDAKYILSSYKVNKEAPIRDYLHIVFHCVFRHMFVNTLLDVKLWNISCDIAVESAISELGLKGVFSLREEQQFQELKNLKKAINQLNAEKIYRYFLDANLSEQRIIELEKKFIADDHVFWYNSSLFSELTLNKQPKHFVQMDKNYSQMESSENTVSDSVGKLNDKKNDQRSDTKPDLKNRDSESDDNKIEMADQVDARKPKQEINNKSSHTTFDRSNDENMIDGNILLRMSIKELEQIWKDISERIQTDLETFSKKQGDAAGGLTQNLIAVNREKYDYASFLRKFSVLGEIMKINDDEFDYIFYTYGIKLYKKMPLIEPLEYKDAKRIKEFVIAIDTSGSVAGDLVQRFITKTFNILKSTESFFSKVNLHIIQCDAKIQKDIKISSQEEFDDYLKNMKLYGFGGTDFRPVFKYVDELINNKEFLNLKGLIYFTDGYGTFPERKPNYETAFVFIDDEYNNPEVPAWAIKLVLQKNEI